MGIGDRLEEALSKVGITSEKVSRWLGTPCNCADRKEKLNQLGYWVNRVLSGKTANSKDYLDAIIGDENR